MDYISAQYPHILASHIPSGESRDPKAGGKLKKMGTKRGLPDIMIWAARHDFHGLAIELKTSTGSPSKDQKHVETCLRKERYLYEIVRKFDDFKQLVDKYLS
jgi:hypothetical protein